MTVDFLNNSNQNSNWKSKSFQKVAKTEKKSNCFITTLYLQQSTFWSPFSCTKNKKIFWRKESSFFWHYVDSKMLRVVEWNYLNENQIYHSFWEFSWNTHLEISGVKILHTYLLFAVAWSYYVIYFIDHENKFLCTKKLSKWNPTLASLLGIF